MVNLPFQEDTDARSKKGTIRKLYDPARDTGGMMIKGQNARNIHPGNSFSEDGLPDEEFDYMLSNPPFGVEWKKVESEVKAKAN